MKKLLSILLSIVVMISTFGAFATSVNAQTYRESLLQKGFPESYVDALVSLHNKYPNWNFVAFNTGLDFNEAVKGELANNSTTEANLKQYLDPRNWLNEKYIFQFESVKREDSEQTKDGVEGILSGTWMNKSLINYYTTGGNLKTYDTTTKYSDAMISASKYSGLSAYYIASKIRQENGGTSASATAVCGTKAPFQGMYNYYNIGAYSTASDGLAWAAGFLKSNKICYLYPQYDSASGALLGEPIAISAGQRMTWRNTLGNVYYVRLYNGESKTYTEGASGYIPISDCDTTYISTNGRPWTNPYKSIKYGAKWIADGYLKYQYTMYLQKFNVNKESGKLYSHEYMANVSGAASEGYHLYSGYTKAGIMGNAKTFYIPVFNNMDSSSSTVTAPAVTGLKLSSKTTSTFSLQWDKQSGADGYYVYKYIPSTNSYAQLVKLENRDICSYDFSGMTSGTGDYFAVSSYVYSNGQEYQSPLCSNVFAYTNPANMSGVVAEALSGENIKVSWNKAGGNLTGYEVKWGKDKDFKSTIATTKIGKSSTTSYTGKNFTKGKTYYIKARTYVTLNGKKYYGAWSSTVSVKCGEIAKKPVKVNNVKLTAQSKQKIKVTWSKVTCNGYEIGWAKDKAFKKKISTTKIKKGGTTSYTGKNFTKGKTYYVRVRAYKTVGGKTYYGSWSSVKSVKAK